MNAGRNSCLDQVGRRDSVFGESSVDDGVLALEGGCQSALGQVVDFLNCHTLWHGNACFAGENSDVELFGLKESLKYELSKVSSSLIINLAIFFKLKALKGTRTPATATFLIVSVILIQSI